MGKPAETSENTAKRTSVIDKLKAHRDGRQGHESVTLSECGVEVTFPKFRKHKIWRNCLALSRNNFGEAQILYVLQVCQFDGEKITEADWDEYISTNDGNELLGEVLGGGSGKDDEGNVSES